MKENAKTIANIARLAVKIVGLIIYNAWLSVRIACHPFASKVGRFIWSRYFMAAWAISIIVWTLSTHKYIQASINGACLLVILWTIYLKKRGRILAAITIFRMRDYYVAGFEDLGGNKVAHRAYYSIPRSSAYGKELAVLLCSGTAQVLIDSLQAVDPDISDILDRAASAQHEKEA